MACEYCEKDKIKEIHPNVYDGELGYIVAYVERRFRILTIQHGRRYPMTRYRKKPVEVEAWQVVSDEPMPEWLQRYYRGEAENGSMRFAIKDLGLVNIGAGSWIVNSEDECIYVLLGRRFEDEYEPIHPYYEEVYDWAFNGMECCDGYEFEMFSKIAGAIAEYRRQTYEVVE